MNLITKYSSDVLAVFCPELHNDVAYIIALKRPKRRAQPASMPMNVDFDTSWLGAI